MLHVQIRGADAAGEETSTSGERSSQGESAHDEVAFLDGGWVTVGKKRRDKEKKLMVGQEEDDGGELKTVRFSSGNPKMEKRSGVVHLFRNVEQSTEALQVLPDGRTEQVCVLAVPSYMSGADFCQFTGEHLAYISKLRIVRYENATNQYMVLLKFDSQEHADDFYLSYNGKQFSSLEPIFCHVFFTSDVQYTDSDEVASTPPAGLVELPTCPVCLERMDAHISGILITVCNHSFHSSCISKWSDSTCPVCRYVQEQPTDSVCDDCGTTENLWMCVICGNVGCGRYKMQHAVNHYKQTGHAFSLECGTQNVWDYAGDGYVHRLLSSLDDGKVVELARPGRPEDVIDAEMEVALQTSKYDAIAMEYNQMTLACLDSQRQHFEERLAQKDLERDMAVAREVEKANHRVSQKAGARVVEAEKELREARHMINDLTANVKELKGLLKQREDRHKKELAAKDATIEDLNEQVRDLLFNFEAQRTFEEAASADPELREGSVQAVPANPPTSAKKGAKPGRKR
ncbi:Zn-finger protein [Klebsormidium nitens]|uniref:Zn-finger protein n=1 Tax=Klebsormidium nitens TaxID=105231 RepID=A0A1Y1HMC1_KLENI|nr:Zn-finger protein [Klebsormidium nitens]|eukprot:GAQ79754.1 Zn-finger protein [Klebsormidium nitens]